MGSFPKSPPRSPPRRKSPPPPARSPRKPVRKALSITTERRLGEGVGTAQHADTTAAGYVTKQRQRRVRKGDVYLRRCCVAFVASLGSVFAAPQYSHRYYVSWATTFATFFLMLPTVLPSDTSRIRVMLVVSIWNCILIASFCALLTRRKINILRNGDCVRVFPRRYCQWNVFYWAFHAGLGGSLVPVFSHAASRLTPASGLQRFWRVTGIYFVTVSLFSFLDKFVASCSGVFLTQEPHKAVMFWWNTFLTFEEFAIGCLCLSHRFKLCMWRYAASYGAITVRPSVPQPTRTKLADDFADFARQSSCSTS